MDSHIEFKRKIDNARNILVGTVPSPAGQIDQITYALIYKFMSDIDDKSARLPGGTRQYFVDEYEKYDWHNLMRLDGQDKLNRYRDALSAMSKNKHLPEIFRSIYQNAFLPYNDPRTLNLFLKEIDGFVHTKSDAIGDAYEYLLSITGAQGDVGQFRTPRHIIKFIVDVVQPGKDDTVLDPACGTAGFLIAAYNYVRMQHDGVGEDGEQNGEQRLTADERKKLHGNYYGYDIDPTMVRTATVNMYLHGFSTPNIEIHDTLTSEEHWQTRYDVILANPPFMTPKGGIQPHGKFGVKANRAEVLFVDYIASHLKPNGRAGIIVPEGVIFQSGNAYKELRKSLVENSLYAVVSLPSGVFNPYAGVKTSILLLDKELAAKKDEILFVKIENDGYSLGAQRRRTAGDQFPEALEIIERFKQGKELQAEFAHAVPRQNITESGDYNLSGDRYKLSIVRDDLDYPLKELGELVEVIGGSTPLKSNSSYWTNGTIPWFTVDDIRHYGRIINKTQKHITEKALQETSIRLVPEKSVLLCCTASVGEFAFTNIQLTTNQQFNALTVKDRSTLLAEYLFWAISDFKEKLEMMAGKTSFSFISAKTLKSMRIPLPPIEIQREIVAELDGYQKIIDAAQTIVQTYKPTIKINPEWESATIGDCVKIERGASPRPIDKYMTESDDSENWVMIGDTKGVTKYITKTAKKVSHEGAAKSRRVEVGDFILSNSMSFGRPYIMKTTGYIHDGWLVLRASEQEKIEQDFLYYILGTEYVQSQFEAAATGGVVRNLNSDLVRNTKIPLPRIEIQREIVAELEAEQQLINASKELIEIYQAKIKSTLAEVWGE